MLGKELGLGKWTVLAGRSLVEINQMCQTHLYLQGVSIPTNRQWQEVDAKIDGMIDAIQGQLK